MDVSPIYDTNPEVSEVDVEANYDEDITAGANFGKINESIDDMEIDKKEERKTESYKVIFNIDIENIENFKISAILIKDIGGQSTKLYNKSSLMKLKFSQRIF